MTSRKDEWALRRTDERYNSITVTDQEDHQTEGILMPWQPT